MKVLLVHNEYQQPGGEDRVFAAEAELLEAHGHHVLRYVVHNDRVASITPVALAASTVWSRASHGELRSIIRRERPQVAHFHNTLPLISPASYYAVKAEGIPVVQTIHNYRLLCPNALYFRDGHVCEDCRGKWVPWPGVLHACYRESRPASAAVAAMLATHRALRTWTEQVDVYIAPSEFTRKKLVQGGLPEEKIVVKPHFVYPEPEVGEGHGGYAVFVGRLSPEKGLDTLLSAWELGAGNLRLKVVGDGPLASRVAEATRRMPKVEWLRRQPPDEILKLMGEAILAVVPSRIYETFGRVVIEAFAKGTPVVGPDLGAIAELVEHGRTGVHFRPDDPKDLAARVRGAVANPTELARMRLEARKEFEARYTAERNYQALKEIYETVVP